MRPRHKATLAVVPPSTPPPALTAHTAPAHLSVEARGLWAGYTATWSFDHAGLVILQASLEAFDALRRAQTEIDRDGLVVAGKAHPATVVARDSRIAMLRGLRMLNLDVIPPEPRAGR